MPQLFALAIGWDYTFDFIRVLSLDPLYSTFGYRADYSRDGNAHFILRAQVLLTLLTILFTQREQDIFSSNYWSELWLANTYFLIFYCGLTLILTISDWQHIPGNMLFRYLAQIVLCALLIFLIGSFKIAEFDDTVITLIYEGKPLFCNQDALINLLTRLSLQDDLLIVFLMLFLLFAFPIVMLNEITLDLKGACLCGKMHSLDVTKQCWFDNFPQFVGQNTAYDTMAQRTLYKNDKTHFILPIIIILCGAAPLIAQNDSISINETIRELFSVLNYMDKTTLRFIIVLGLVMLLIEIYAKTRATKRKKEGKSIIERMTQNN